MWLGFTCYFFFLLLVRGRAEILSRERNKQWLKDALGATS